ncbi:hypothetical protein F4782DRAFT_534178 [Xylaria castorea]|nr:hypothetical protein F4782DRAFT_534178 [Xylaria castorea]
MQEPTPKETALSIVLSSRSYGPSAVVKRTPTPKIETKSFRELFCASLELQPVVAAPAPGETATPSNTKAYDIKGNNSKDTSTQIERSTKSTLSISSGEPIDSSKGSKTLRSSRWAKDDTMVDCELKTLKCSRWAGYDQKDAPRRMVTNTKPFQQNTIRYTRKTPKNLRWAKDGWKEAPLEPPRVNFDWEEFEREVKENNLKTLKDSRWA